MIDCIEIFDDFKDFNDDLMKCAKQTMTPFRGTFELTARCNFNCKMCYVHLTNEQANKIGQELSNEEWIRIALEARDAGLLYLTLTGGEIFTRPKFKELYLELHKMGFLIVLQSNGYFIDEKVMEWLSIYPPYRIRFTLYGVSDETYRVVTGIQDGFTRVNHAIDLILQAGIPFHMVGTIIKDNEKDLEEMYRYARKKGVYFMHTMGVVSPVRGATADVAGSRISSISTETLKKMITSMKKTQGWYYHRPFFLDDCGNYKSNFWLTWNGKLSLCAFMSKHAIDVQVKPFLEAWMELNKKLVANIRVPDKCKTCKFDAFCKRCPGILEAECGDPSQANAEFCKIAETYYELFYVSKEKERI